MIKQKYAIQIIFYLNEETRLSPPYSSNVNEVIRAVLNSLFFLWKDFARTKSTKSAKSTKAQRRSQAKAQNATREQK